MTVFSMDTSLQPLDSHHICRSLSLSSSHPLFSSNSFVPSAACSLVYLVLGLLCFDRFTSRAFLSHKDPIASTAISQGNASHQTPPQIALNNYNPPGGVGA